MHAAVDGSGREIDQIKVGGRQAGLRVRDRAGATWVSRQRRPVDTAILIEQSILLDRWCPASTLAHGVGRIIGAEAGIQNRGRIYGSDGALGRWADHEALVKETDKRRRRRKTKLAAPDAAVRAWEYLGTEPCADS